MYVRLPLSCWKIVCALAACTAARAVAMVMHFIA